MFHPTTGLLVASHDAWLEEMKREPSPGRGRVAKFSARKGFVRGVASRLAGVASRLREGSWPEASTQPDAPAQATGASI